MASESFAQLYEDAEMLAILPPEVISAVRNDLRGCMFRDPHGDAIIDSVEVEDTPGGIPAIIVNLRITVYPSSEAINQFYRSGLEGAMRAPTEIDLKHTVVVELKP